MRQDELASIHFEAAVLSKNVLGSSAAHRKAPNLPVITERLMRWILGDPHHQTLAALWNTVKERAYFPVPGVHYSDQAFKAAFNGIEFEAPDQGMVTLKPWAPESDIRIITV
jgi:hypothetical protein